MSAWHLFVTTIFGASKPSMNKFLASMIAVALCIHNVSAQDIVVDNLRKETSRTIKKEADTSTWRIKHGGLFSLNLSQGSLSNWAAGGDNFSLSIASYFNYYHYYKEGRNFWDNNLDANLGFVQTTSLGGRKNDDRIDFLSKYGYKMDSTGKWYISGLFNFRSQFFDGYTYPGADPVFSSSVLSPAYIILSAGFDYKQSDKFSLFISPLTSRWTIVLNNRLAAIGSYGVDSGKHSINAIGAFLTVNYATNIQKIIDYKGRLDLFSNYKHNPQNVDLYMTNLFAIRINKYFSATYSLDLIYDDDVRIFGPQGKSPALQAKSMVGISFLRTLNTVRIK